MVEGFISLELAGWKLTLTISTFPPYNKTVMFEVLSEKLNGVFRLLGNRGKLTEKDIDDALNNHNRQMD